VITATTAASAYIAFASDSALAATNAARQAPASTANQGDKSWIARSNEFANLLIEVEKKHAPESASADGLSQYDEKISAATHEDDVAATSENRAVLAKLQDRLPKEQNKYVRQDLEIMIHSTQLQLKQHDFAESRQIPYLNASGAAYQGLRVLLDDQVAPERRPAAVVRLRKYAGLEPGYTPFTDRLRMLTELQLAKPNMIYPAKARVETALSRNTLYVDGIADLFKQYKLQGWEEPYAKLKQQLTAYDQWVTSEILPKARTDFRQPPELYALGLEGYGIDIPPAELATMAHEAFTEYQAEMQTIAAQIAKQHGWPSSDYRDVIKKLKENQLVGDAILPFYKDRLKDIEGILVKDQLISLPDRPARIRIGTPAESAQQPAPHMVPPPLLNNTGQQGEFVLPLNMPAAAGSAKVEKGGRLHLRRGFLDADRARGPPRPRTAIRFHDRARRILGAFALRVQQHQRRRLGALCRIHHQAPHAAGRPVDLAAVSLVAGRTRLSRSRAAGGKNPARGRHEGAHRGWRFFRAIRKPGSRALYVPRARPGQFLFLWIHETPSAKKRYRSGSGTKVRSKEIP
jgi:hypothetical protein